MILGRDHSPGARSAEPEEFREIVSPGPRRRAPVAAVWARASAAGGRWRRWSSASDNRRIFAAAAVVGCSIMVVKIAAMAKDLVAAASFGTTDAMDAFLIAFVLPSFVFNLVSGSFSAALVPTYIEVRDRRGRAAADEMLSSVVLISLGVLGIVTLLLAVLGPQLLPILASGFDEDKLALTRRLFYFMLPCIVFSGIGTLWSAVLNASEHFALAELAQIAVPVVSVVALLIGGDRWGIFALAVGFVGGFLAELMLLAWGGMRAGIKLSPRWHGRTPEVNRVVGQYLPMLAGSLLLGTAPLIDQAMAATLGSGSVAALGYGNKVIALVLTIGSMSVGTAVLPYFSRMIAAGDMAAVRHTLRTYCRLIVAVTVPVTVGIVLFSDDIVRIIFERGAFTAADTHLVSRIQALFALQIPFYVLSILLVRLISALKANHLLMIGTALSFVINLSMNYILKQMMGVAGIALSTTLVYICSLAFLAMMLTRILPSGRMAARGVMADPHVEPSRSDRP